MLVDSHCHLDFPELAGDVPGVIARARAEGVGHMVTISTRVAKWDTIRTLAEAHAEVSCTVGTHPHNAGEEAERAVTVERLVELSRHPKAVGIGESGLDYFYDKSPRDDQAEGFRRHIRACLETGLPIIVHSRDAEADTAAILEEEGKGKLTGVLHCFSSRRELAEAGLRMGLYVSFSGILTFKRSDELRAIAADVPLDRLLVETDSPYLAPVPHRGHSNQPAYVRHTAEVLAEVKGVTPERLAEATTRNFRRLFSKAALS
jgi:TatD DNase family protein